VVAQIDFLPPLPMEEKGRGEQVLNFQVLPPHPTPPHEPQGSILDYQQLAKL
jgi:hypothetical protein